MFAIKRHISELEQQENLSMEKKSRTIEVLLAILAFALIVIALLLYLQFDGSFDSLPERWRNCWNKFILPVATNLVSTLAAISVTILIIRRWLPERDLDRPLGEAIEQKLWPKLAQAIDNQCDASKASIRAEVRASSSECTKGLSALLSQLLDKQLNNQKAPSLNKEDEDSQEDDPNMGQQPRVTPRKSNKKPRT